MRSAHGVEIEVLAADLGGPRAPQEILAFTEERGDPARWTSRVISPAVVSNLTVNDYRITPAGAIIETALWILSGEDAC